MLHICMRRNTNTGKFSGAILLLLTLLLPLGATAQNAAEDQDANSQINQLFDWIDGMNAEAEKLEDINAIGRLQRAYGYYIDKGYWKEAAALFTNSATLEVGVDGVYIGRPRILQMLIQYGGGSADAGPGLRFGQMNRHMQLQPVITVSDNGITAQARWRNFSLLGEYLRAAYWGDTILENTYRKENGVWKIQSLHLYPNFVAPYQTGWANLNSSAEDWRSDASRQTPPDSPPSILYQPFPEPFTAPFHYPLPASVVVPSWSSRISNLNSTSSAVQGLLAKVRDYARELDNLKAERDIENLQAKYGYYIDKGMWREAANLFAVDASYEFGQSGVYLGRSRIAQAIALMGPQGLENGMLNNYPMLQPIIHVAADNKTAMARWRSDVQLSRNGRGTWGGGVYENEYVNENGTWRISKLHYYVTFWADYDKGWDDGYIPMPDPSPVLPPDLPPTEVYGAHPEVYLFPFHYQHPVTGKPARGNVENTAATQGGNNDE